MFTAGFSVVEALADFEEFPVWECRAECLACECGIHNAIVIQRDLGTVLDCKHGTKLMKFVGNRPLLR